MRTWWTPTADSYLHHVPKGLILEAVREAVGAEAADRIAGMKKEVMA
jgi:ParB family chromosome partitioning protein